MLRLFACLCCVGLGLFIAEYQSALYVIGDPTDKCSILICAALFVAGLVIAVSFRDRRDTHINDV